jgi:hypothetical protein
MRRALVTLSAVVLLAFLLTACGSADRFPWPATRSFRSADMGVAFSYPYTWSALRVPSPKPGQASRRSIGYRGALGLVIFEMRPAIARTGKPPLGYHDAVPRDERALRALARRGGITIVSSRFVTLDGLRFAEVQGVRKATQKAPAQRTFLLVSGEGRPHTPDCLLWVGGPELMWPENRVLLQNILASLRLATPAAKAAQ